MAIPSIINGDHQLLDNDMAIDVMVNIIITDENLWSTHGHTLNQLQMPPSLPNDHYNDDNDADDNDDDQCRYQWWLIINQWPYHQSMGNT